MNNLEAFRNKEIKGLRTLRLAAITCLIILNISILLVFGYLFYTVYAERSIAENFLSYTSPTLVGIQCVLLLVLIPLFMVISYRFNYVIEEIRHLNDEFLALYQENTKSTIRPFPNIPKYIISQKGLIIIKNLKKIILGVDSVDKITIEYVNLGRGLRICMIKFYQHKHYATKIKYARQQPPELDFLKQNIRLIQRHVVIVD